MQIMQQNAFVWNWLVVIYIFITDYLIIFHIIRLISFSSATIEH